MLDLLIREAHVMAPEDLGITNIGIRDGKIVFLGKQNKPAREVILAGGKTAMPGAIESHAHMLLPFGGTQTMNDFYTGTKAAAIGGVTMLIDFADQTKGGRIETAIEKRCRQAKDSVIDYAFHCTLTDINRQTLEAVPVLAGKGFRSLKFYTAYSASGLYVPPKDLEKAFLAAAACGSLATVHAEDEEEILKATRQLMKEGKTSIADFPKSRPDRSEEKAIQNVVGLAGKTKTKLLIRHVTSAAGVEIILQAQKRGQTVIGETCPQYLLLTRKVYAEKEGELYICNPPIRGEKDRQALWKALREETKFIVGTDDCAFYKKQKRVSTNFYEVPGGMPGIETRVPLILSEGVYSGRISMERAVRVLSTDVAKTYGLYPRKGVITEGSDADIVLAEETVPYRLHIGGLHENTDYTPYEGRLLHYRVSATVSKGKVLYQDGVFRGRRGDGKWLPMGMPCAL